MPVSCPGSVYALIVNRDGSSSPAPRLKFIPMSWGRPIVAMSGSAYQNSMSFGPCPRPPMMCAMSTGFSSPLY